MSDRDIENWKTADVIDTAPYDDAYFADLAGEIDAALSPEVPVPEHDVRDLLIRWGAIALAASIAVYFAVPSAPDDSALVAIAPPAIEAPESSDSVEDERLLALTADLLPSGLDDLAEEDDLEAQLLLATALESDYGLADESDDRLAAAGSWIADLEDLTRDELALLAAKL